MSEPTKPPMDPYHAARIVRSRQGRPREDDWELMDAADVLARIVEEGRMKNYPICPAHSG